MGAGALPGSALPIALRLGGELCADPAVAARREWLISNGLGSYGSGTVAGGLSRSYHGLLVAALGAPADPCTRTLLVAALEERAGPGLGWDGFPESWPAWQPLGPPLSFRLEGGVPCWLFAVGETLLEKRLWMVQGSHTTVVHYRVLPGGAPLRLEIGVLVNARCHHGGPRHAGGDRHRPIALEAVPRGVRLTPAVAGVPAFQLLSDRGQAELAPPHDWVCGLPLAVEAERGLPSQTDHLRACRIRAELSASAPSLTLVASSEADPCLDGAGNLEQRRRHEAALLTTWQAAQPNLAPLAPAWVRQLVLAADSFLVAREDGVVEAANRQNIQSDASPGSQPRPGVTASAPPEPGAERPSRSGHTILAGYPWFGDWGRDTMISLAGLTLATGRHAIAAGILRTWARHLSRGLLPNRFPEGSAALGDLDYNSVDATLWYVEALRRYLQASGDLALIHELLPALAAIITAHLEGTRHGIRRDPADGLLSAGADGLQLTWMDAKVNGEVITPRRGKPVEVNALWFCALQTLAHFQERCGGRREPYASLAEQARLGFQRFWNPQAGCCWDVLDDPDGLPDGSLRPNQLLAVALTDQLLSPEQARQVVAVCSARLLTPLGLRSLDPADRRYQGHYGGGPLQRDRAYHQGTVWAWWLGPWARAHARVHGDPRPALRWLEAIGDHLGDAGIGSISEIADGDPPHAPRGCIAQAWSVAEVLQAWTELTAMASAEQPSTRTC